MKKIFFIFSLSFYCTYLFGQTFNSTSSANLGTTYSYLPNGINVSGLSNLDGISLGVTSIKLTISGGRTFPLVGNLNTTIDLYLVAPDGYAAFITSNNYFLQNGEFIFTVDALNSIKNKNFTNVSDITNPYQPYGNLNSLNNNQLANGTWRLYAKNNGISATINNWAITFGSNNLSPGSLNQSCRSALPLKNSSVSPDSFVSGTSQYHGVVISDSYGSEGNTETSVWYSFVPKCNNDIIEIKATNSNYIQSHILRAGCAMPKSTPEKSSEFQGQFTYNTIRYTPGNVYYLLMDGSNAETIGYEVRWYTGTDGCIRSDTITTFNSSKAAYCPNDTIHIGFKHTGTYTAGNRFTAQLSDANGSFALPQTIGYIDGTIANKIIAQFPSTLTAASGYRVRVISSSPTTATLLEGSAFQINSVPSAPTAFLTSDVSVCAGESGVSYSVSPLSNVTHYHWQFPSNSQSTSLSTDSASVSVHFGNTSGIISVQAVNACGRSASFQKDVVVQDTLRPQVSIQGSNTFCQGSALSFVAATKNKGTNPVFTWHHNKSLLLVTDSVATFSSLSDQDTIRVQLKSSLECAIPNPISATPVIVHETNSILPTVVILGDSIACEGSTFSFTSLTTGGGTSPIYTWKVNGLTKGNGPTFSGSQFGNKDEIVLELRSSDLCANPVSVVSNRILISITEKTSPSVLLSLTKTGFCQGDSIIFKALPSHGGNRPKYTWKINSKLIGDTTDELITNTLQNGDSVKVEMTSNAICQTSQRVDTFLVAFVTDTLLSQLNVIGDTLICQGSTAVFQATIQPFEQNISYQWYLNGNLQANQSDRFISNLLKDKDSIWVSSTSSFACARPKNLQSTKLHIHETRTIAPVVFISGPVTNICKDSLLVYSANISGGGQKPSIRWYINNKVQEDTLAVFSSKNLQNGDSIFAQVRTTEDCGASDWISSNKFRLGILDTITPTLALLAEKTYCKNQSITLQTSVQNAGSQPRFEWELNGQPFLNNNSPSFSPTSLPIGLHSVLVTLTSNAECSRPATLSTFTTFEVKDSLHPIVLIQGDSIVCEGSIASFQLAANLHLSSVYYQWQLNGNPVGENLPTYTSNDIPDKSGLVLVVQTDEKCIRSNEFRSNQVTIKVKPSSVPQLTISVSQKEICAGENVIYRASVENRGTDEVYTWYTNGSAATLSDSLVFSSVENSIITLTYKTLLGCGPYSKEITAPAVSIKHSPILSTLSGPAEFCAQDKNLSFSTDFVPNAIYSWSFPTSAKGSQEQNKLILDLEGNIQPDSIKVKAHNECGEGNELSFLLFPKNCSTLFIPNAIVSTETNGNSTWQIKGLELHPKATVQVFNRWGVNVYGSQGYLVPWDGTFQGKLLPVGTYYYVIEGVENKPISGDLTIVH